MAKFTRKALGVEQITRQYDADGKQIEFDVREDEEQNVKLTQTVDLLLAAGYFRARIKGLSPFDKVVGGMVWCITTCSYDINVDILFEENSTIGQKIAVTEKIVAVLPTMKCPHRIEPHQIQGLDFIHIFPVVQWLVKRAIEVREETGDYIRSYSLSQFNKNFKYPEDKVFEERFGAACTSLDNVKESYRPQRKYRRHDKHSELDRETRVHCTLLEYGKRYSLVGSSSQSQEDQKTSTGPMQKVEDGEKETEEEKRRLDSLMRGMSAMGLKEEKLTASAVGSIVGLQSEHIQQIAAQYAHRQQELEEIAQKEKLHGAEQHRRTVMALNNQLTAQQDQLTEITKKTQQLQQSYEETKEKLTALDTECGQLDRDIEELSFMDDVDKSVLETLRSLVAMNDTLKKQEQEFRAHCKSVLSQEEMARLQMDVSSQDTDESAADQERSRIIEQQYETDHGKLQKIRILLARRNREIAAIQRKMDEVPTRAELTQYQKRFIELYNQVAAKHKETKQFYTLYNTLDDTKRYLDKEIKLLNSIHETFEQAMSSSSNKDQFLKQFEHIVDGVKQNRAMVERRKQEEKMRRDQLSDSYVDLVDKQRLYFKTVKDFQEECRKNEILQSKLST